MKSKEERATDRRLETERQVNYRLGRGWLTNAELEVQRLDDMNRLVYRVTPDMAIPIPSLLTFRKMAIAGLQPPENGTDEELIKWVGTMMVYLNGDAEARATGKPVQIPDLMTPEFDSLRDLALTKLPVDRIAEWLTGFARLQEEVKKKNRNRLTLTAANLSEAMKGLPT